MASIAIRDIDEDVKRRSQVRATRNGPSMERIVPAGGKQRLNERDGLSHALARSLDGPLLGKRDDLVHADIRFAVGA